MSRYIYGYDLAQTTDYFAVVIHNLEPGAALPKLTTLRKMQGGTYPNMMRVIKEKLWEKYPPFYQVTDYTNEKTFSEWLIEKWGDERVDAINFTIQNKLMLKQDGRKVLELGYSWPRSDNPQVQGWIRETQDQLQHEQMMQTLSRKITFDHPQGEHNDMAIAWELSVHGCLKFMLQDKVGGLVMGSASDSDYWENLKSKEERVIDNITARMRNKLTGANVTDIKIV